MRSTHNDFLTREKSEKLTSVGQAFQSGPLYTKADYLTPGKVAKKFTISTEKAQSLMKDLLYKNAIFALNGRKAQIVVRLGKRDSIYLHPMAIEAFKRRLEEQKD